MDGFERRKEQSREDIRRATEELFTRFGIAKVSVNDIARKAGVSQATIYNNFGSKDELVHDYHNNVVKKIVGSLHGILLWKKSWAEKMLGFLESWIDIADRYRSEIDNVPEPSREALAKEIRGSFVDFIREGQAHGNLRADISDEAIINYIRFFQQGIIRNPDIREKMQRDARLSQDMFSLFQYGVSGQPAA